MKRTVLFLTILAWLPVAASCGGGGGDRLSKDEYAGRVATIGDTLEQSFAGVATQAQSLGGEPSSVADLQELMGQLAEVTRGGVESLQAAADELEGISPPEEVQEAHDKLVEGLQLLAADFETFAAAVEAGEFTEITQLAAGLQDIAASEAGQLLQEATDELKEKGYDIEGEGG